jgi:hypothetical protein
MKRRDFLKVGASTFVVGNVSGTYAEEKNKSETAVLYVFLNGGASHIETFNPVPLAPADRRSTTGAIQTNVAGIEIGGLFKEVAKRTHKIAIPRAFGHRDQNHASSVHWVVTGEANFGAGTSSKWPSMGSAMARYHGPNTEEGLPTYVKIGGFEHDDAAWLGGKYMGFDATREGRKDLQLLGKSDDFRKRLYALDVIDKNFVAKNQQLAQDWSALREQSVDIILGSTSQAFRVENDPKYAEFKDSQFGSDALTAVRLLEAGSRFVTLTTGGWDMHQNIATALNTRQVELDTYLGKLMDLLEERNMYERVMLVVTSEFGRTPKVNQNAGRDHFGKLAPLMISCGNYEMGRTIGQTNASADDYDQDGRSTPEDLACTVFDHLNMDRKTRWTGTDGRPHNIIKETSKNILKEIA